MISSQIPGNYISVLFNMSEFEEELKQAGDNPCCADYLAWILVGLGFPVITPPWTEEPRLNSEAKLVKTFHEREVYAFVLGCLKRAGYSGEELFVTARQHCYCAVSFYKESAG